MDKLRELIERMKRVAAEENSNSIEKLHRAVILMGLNLNPRNKFGGEFERMSKIVSIADVLYWYLVIVAHEGLDIDQLIKIVEHKLEKSDQAGPEMRVMAPEVHNKNNTQK
jgi:hypothetical protein